MLYHIKIKDFGPLVTFECATSGAAIITAKRVGRGWSATDGRAEVKGSKQKVLAWAKARAGEIAKGWQ